jgi:hypothetical protein
LYKFVLGKTCPDREQSQGGVGVGCVFLPPEQRQTHLGDEDVPQFMGEQDERVSRHELHPVDPLLFCEAFETRTVQGGFRSGLDPLPESRLSRLSLLCDRRNGAEKRTPSAAHQILRPTSLMFTAISCASGNLMASASIRGKRQLRCLSHLAPEPRAQLDRAKRADDQHVGGDTPSNRELGGSDCVARAAIATSSKTGPPCHPLEIAVNPRRSGSKPTLVFMPT